MAVDAPRPSPNGRRGVIVELIGAAGSGKSTLCKALEKADPGLKPEPLPPVWQASLAPFFVSNIFSLLPVLARMQVNGDRRLNRRELAWMAMLNGWAGRLEKQTRSNLQTILLDQGPIFLMAILSGFGPQSLKQANLLPWWSQINRRWAYTLDLVVWLDAPDETLAKRIRGRDSEHVIKGRTDAEVNAFLAKYRNIYDDLVQRLCVENPALQVLRLDTSRGSRAESLETIRLQIEACKKNPLTR